MSKKTNTILIVTVITLVLLVTGGTYAFLTFNASVSNNIYNGGTTKFVVDYSYGDSTEITTGISGTLMQVSHPTGGIAVDINMNLNEDSGVMAIGYIYLKVNSDSDTLYDIVADHCEISNSLISLKSVYIDKTTCEAAGHTWISGGTALKYALYRNVTYTDTTANADLIKKYILPVASGYITGTGDITIRDEFVLGVKEQKYTLYIWLDGELADYSYASLPFSGYVHLSAEQTEVGADCDIDGDGVSQMEDITIVNHIVSTNTYSSIEEKYKADLNADGFVDAVDFEIISDGSYCDSLPSTIYELGE